VNEGFLPLKEGEGKKNGGTRGEDRGKEG